VKIFINFKRCCLQLDSLNKLLFSNKNWLNDPWIGCKYIFNLVELIEIDIKLKELDEFEKNI
jgi:hypothetical protein